MVGQSLIRTLAVMLLAAPLAGCVAAEEPQATDEHEEDEHEEEETGGNETENETNLPPEITVVVMGKGTPLATTNGSIEATAGVNLTFDASNSTDPEGGNLTFSWDFGDGNTSDAASVVHAFSVAGNYTVTVTVDDEDNGSASQSLSLVITPGGPAPGTVVQVEAKQFKGTVTAVDEVTCGTASAGTDKLSFTWDIPAALPDGTAVRISQFTMKITQSATNVDTDFYFNGPDGKEIGSSHAFEPLDGAEKGFTVDGDFGPGAYKVRVQSCTAVNNAVTIDMTGTYVAG